MTYYVALLAGDDEGFGFVVPDVPGFAVYAETTNIEEAIATARRVLADHLAALLDHGSPLPNARSLKDLRADPEYREDFAEADAVVMMPALVPSGRTKRVNVTIDENTLDLIDRSAADRNLTRSAFIAEAARQMATA
jgi:predicted RNase H-like HicB family nuclease